MGLSEQAGSTIYELELEDLVREQRLSLWLDGHEGLDTAERALAFIDEVGVALRYGAAKDLPLASLYRATQRQVPMLEDEKVAHSRAFKLTNELLAGGHVVEINVIAGRLGLAHMRLMPAIYTLRRGLSRGDLSDMAQDVFDCIAANETASRGDICRQLGVVGQARPDPVDVALTELQHDLLIDRGPSSVPTSGIFYLSKEGYPYRVLARAHPEITTAADLSREVAAEQLLSSYLAAARFAVSRKLAAMFQLLLRREEIEATLKALVVSGQAEVSRLGQTEAVVFRG